jgi:hypothetical protein
MSEAPTTIDVVGFMDLARLFKERGWRSPHVMPLDRPIGGLELLARLEVSPDAVESLFVDHRAIGLFDAVIRPGSRVALVPPGVPGPHRFCLGIWRGHPGGQAPSGGGDDA